jgi:hypothetical protein
MLRKLFNFLTALGTRQGLSFRLVVEDGVGLFLVPNPTPTRQQIGVFEVPPRSQRCGVRKASGKWVAKRVRAGW